MFMREAKPAGTAQDQESGQFGVWFGLVWTGIGFEAGWGTTAGDVIGTGQPG